MKYAAVISLLLGMFAACAAGDSLSVASEPAQTVQATTMPAAAVPLESPDAHDLRLAVLDMRRQIDDLKQENARLRKELGIYQTKEADRIIQERSGVQATMPDEKLVLGEKTVHVRAYTRTDGTQVREHYRRPPAK